MFGIRTKGQTTLEVVLLISFVVAAITAMSLYLNRASQGQLRRAADQVGDQFDAPTATSSYTYTTNTEQQETTYKEGGSLTNIITGVTKKTGGETPVGG